MEIEKSLTLDAPPERVWALLLDPEAMGTCVPGMESVQVLSADEYAAVMKVKISFVSARFRLRTRIVERDAPRYLRAEGTGEDSAVASSLKQVSEIWLEPGADGMGTRLRLKVQVDVLGRIGSFGLAAMKTKADRLWDEFGVHLAARLAPPAPALVPAPAVVSLADPGTLDGAQAGEPGASAPPEPSAAQGVAAAPPASLAVSGPASLRPGQPAPRISWWRRLLGHSAEPIRIELRRGDLHLSVSFPAEAAGPCTDWLRTVTDSSKDNGTPPAVG